MMLCKYCRLNSLVMADRQHPQMHKATYNTKCNIHLGTLPHLNDLRSACISLRAALRSSTSPDSKDSRRHTSDSLDVLLEAARTFTIASPGCRGAYIDTY
jgi:hypothetical protein